MITNSSVYRKLGLLRNLVPWCIWTNCIRGGSAVALGNGLMSRSAGLFIYYRNWNSSAFPTRDRSHRVTTLGAESWNLKRRKGGAGSGKSPIITGIDDLQFAPRRISIWQRPRRAWHHGPHTGICRLLQLFVLHCQVCQDGYAHMIGLIGEWQIIHI
jgi:hypothetical protein